jgi:AcrR family transcriptional regulator
MKNAERVLRTRKALLDAAQTLFSEKGFGATSTEEILAAAGVTRGALYHHFADKTALFAEVCAELMAEAARRIEAATEGVDESLRALEAGFAAWFGYVLDPGVRNVLLVEAPTVLGFARWRALDEAHSFQALRSGVAEALLNGALEFAGEADELAAMINGAANDLALRGTRPERAVAAIRQLIDGFRPR